MKEWHKVRVDLRVQRDEEMEAVNKDHIFQKLVCEVEEGEEKIQKIFLRWRNSVDVYTLLGRSQEKGTK